MSEHRSLIQRKLEHLGRMRGYLEYSREQIAPLLPVRDWSVLGPEQHESLAAFRVRFSEFQEHLGKTMRAIAIEEEQRTEPFTAVLVYMEKLGILSSTERWRVIRELRNAVNHEYEENAERLSAFFLELGKAVPELLSCYDRLVEFVECHYTGAS